MGRTTLIRNVHREPIGPHIGWDELTDDFKLALEAFVSGMLANPGTEGYMHGFAIAHAQVAGDWTYWEEGLFAPTETVFVVTEETANITGTVSGTTLTLT